MYAVEFEAPIENGVVHIPKQYKELQQTQNARIVVMYDNSLDNTVKKDDPKSQLQEFRKLRAQSNNKVIATMELATDIDKLADDGIF